MTGARRSRTTERGAQGERAAALVEFAFVMIPLFILIFGIITFGILLSFKQNLTEAAADGARAAAYVPAGVDTNPVNGVDDRIDEALQAVELAVNAYDRSCNDPGDGLTCTATITDCDGVAGGPECIDVRIDFDNTGETALLPAIPLIDRMVPDTLSARSIVESL